MTSITNVDLTSAELAALNTGLAVIDARQERNSKIVDYYDAQAKIRDLGIAIPPHLRNIETVLGWPAKTVDVRESRMDLEYWVSADGTVDPLGLDELWADNGMDLEQSLAHTSGLMLGVVFVTASAGDVSAGEPEVLYSIHEATNATIGWNPRARRADWFVGITARRNSGDPRVVILSLPDQIITLRLVRNAWVVERIPHGLQRVPATMLVRRPRVGRRFGMPVISRPVISLTDSGVRTLLRSEVSAEFFSVPQRYALGVDDDAFTGGGWQAVIGKFLAVSRDANDEIPTLGQFPQVSMQGHTEQMRMLATSFAGESTIPVDYLGVIQDNPSSADAIKIHEAPMIEDITRDSKTFGAGWRELQTLGVMIRDGLSEAPQEMRGIRPRWADPSTPTRSAQTQNVVSLIQSGSLPPTSRITYELLGFDKVTIDALTADARRAQAGTRLQDLVAAAQNVRANGNSGASQPLPIEQ